MMPVDILRSKWNRLGFRYANEPYCEQVDIERTVTESIEAGREFPDVFWAMLTWIIANGDLINIPRFSHMATGNNGALSAAVAELALSYGADSRLLRITARQHPHEPAEVLFNVMATSQALSQREQDESLDAFTKWGYFCSGASIKRDALHDRAWILSKNRNLALRAVFGPHARADILFALMNSPGLTINRLSMSIGVSYQPVYTEVSRLINNGLLTCQVWGRSKVVRLSESARVFLNAVPPLETA